MAASIQRTVDAPEQERVLFLLTTDLSATFVQGQLAEVNALGFDVHLATAFDAGTARAVDTSTTTWHLPFVREPNPLRDARSLAATIRLLRRLRPKAVHAGTPKAGLVGMIAAWGTRTPVRIYAVHGLRYETADGLGRRLLMWAERLACACATAVVADSQSLKQVMIRDRICSRSKISVIGPGSSNGVDLDRFHPADREAARVRLGVLRDVPVLGFIGRLTHDKGIDDLVQVHRSLVDRAKAVLLLVGDFEPDDPVAEETRNYISSGPDVIHLRWTDRPEDIYPALDLLVFPSRREGLPNVPLEAQACGVPVIGYRATGTIDAVASAPLLVPVGDVQALESLADGLVTDPDQLMQLGAEARVWVSRFDANEVRGARARFIQRQIAGTGNRQ